MVSEEEFQKFKKIDTDKSLSSLLRNNQIDTPEIRQSVIECNFGYGTITKDYYAIIATQTDSGETQFELYDATQQSKVGNEIVFPEIKYHQIERNFLEDLKPQSLDGALPNVIEFVEKQEYIPEAIVHLHNSSMEGGVVYSREIDESRDPLELMVIHQTDSGLYAARHIHRSIIRAFAEPRNGF